MDKFSLSKSKNQPKSEKLKQKDIVYNSLIRETRSEEARSFSVCSF
jgi:hypothetical protein